MKFQQAILSVIAALLLCGCGLVTGEKIEFGHSFPYEKYQGRTYNITNNEDAQLVLKLKDNIYRGKDTLFGSRNDLDEILGKYKSGFQGWF